MKRDRVMEELWKAKDELARRFGYDLDRLCEHLRGPEEPLSVTLRNSRRKTRVRKRTSKSAHAKRNS